MSIGPMTVPGILLYLDAGAGSYFFQLLMATMLGVGFSVKLYWKKIASLWVKRPHKPDAEKPDHV
ncbi:MAG TPA: hypothetical protein VF982_08760 [Anaerolineales bacterium]